MKGSHGIKKLYGVQEEGMRVEEEFVLYFVCMEFHNL